MKGLKQAAAERLVAARRERPFTSVADLARRAGLDRRDLEALAAGDALKALAGHRHAARWAVLGSEATLPLFPEPAADEPADLRPPAEGEALVADYASTGLSLGRHPLALLRGELRRRGFGTCAEANARRDRSPVRLAGIVITRQRPGDGRTTFLTLEDETGIANVIVWERLGERYRREVVGARLIGVMGQVQSESGVVHVVARRLADHSGLLGALATQSRDFC